MPAQDALPGVAHDDGRAVVIKPGSLTRALGLIVGPVLVVVAVFFAVVAPGELAEQTGARIAVPVVIAFSAVVAVMRSQRKLAFDADGVTEVGLTGRREMSWSDVEEVRLHEGAAEDAPGPGRGQAQVGGMEISAGAGGGHRRRGLAGGRRNHVLGAGKKAVSMRVRNGVDRDMTVRLDGASLAEAEALASLLQERSWLPEDVQVTVSSKS